MRFLLLPEREAAAERDEAERVLAEEDRDALPDLCVPLDEEPPLEDVLLEEVPLAEVLLDEVLLVPDEVFLFPVFAAILPSYAPRISEVKIIPL